MKNKQDYHNVTIKIIVHYWNILRTRVFPNNLKLSIISPVEKNFKNKPK